LEWHRWEGGELKSGFVFRVKDIWPFFERPDGHGAPGNAIRGWARRGIIEAYQVKPNAEWHLTAKGVTDAWRLWARHKGLAPEAMPKGLKKLLGDQATEKMEAALPETVVRIEITIRSTGAVEVVQSAA
jgi:hypothetical protein